MSDLLDRQITHYQKALLIKPDRPEVYYHLGEIWEKLEQREKAIDCYLQVIYLYREASQIKDIFAKAYIQLIKVREKCPIDQAIRIYRQFVDNHPDFAIAHVGLGDLLTQQGNLEEAIFCYKNTSYQQLLGSHPEFVKNYWQSENPRQPHFLIIGIGKGGTSSLYRYLGKHPQILPAIKKETFFFTENISQGLDWYLAHFPPIPKGADFLTGEATPWYLVSFDVEKQVAKLFPDIKIIILLRNPGIRSFSQYQMQRRLGKEHRSLAEVISSEMEAISKLPSLGNPDGNYWQTGTGCLLFSLYVYFIEKWMAVFPREQFLILKSEDFYANPAATLTQVFDFLGVPDYPLPEYPNYNPGSYNPISDDLRQTLADFFRPHNQKLEEYLGMKFDWD
jgi:hypothetical protein